MSDLDELGELDALHKDRTGRGIEFSAEEARLLDELLASADIGSPIPPPVPRAHRHHWYRDLVSVHWYGDRFSVHRRRAEISAPLY